MLVRLRDLNGAAVYVNPDNVLFVGSVQDRGQVIVNGCAVNMVGGVALAVGGTPEETARILSPDLAKFPIPSEK